MGDEDVTGLTADTAGNLYISGSTNSSDFPLNKAFDQTLETGPSAREGFVVMLPADGGGKIGWASFVGGNDTDVLNALSISYGTRLIVAGQTASSTGLITYDRPQEDGVHVDLDHQTSTSFLAANWEDFTDPESSIVEYACGFGTAPGLDDVSPFTPTSVSLQRSCSTQKQLTPGQTYYFTVRATNSQGLITLASSNGVQAGEAPSPDGGVDGGTDEPPTGGGDDKALLGWSCAAAEAGPLMLVGLVALLMLARQRGGSSR
ncbi:MAG: SBBP repeat-containing protein [Hyalangium sp.]